MALKWGIVGTGRISNDFVSALSTRPPSEHQVVAVAAGTKARADKFAEDHAIPNSYDGYLKLAEDKEVEVVYIGNLNPQHFDAAKLMLEHGKHVLCEKPFTMNEKQTRRLIEIARKSGLFLMEGIWSRCFPAYIEMKRLIDTGAIGDVLFVAVHFGHPIQHVERVTSKELGGGSILDLGVYALQLQQYIFRGLKPIKIVANGQLNKHETDDSCGAVTTYPDGKTAVMGISARVKLPNEGIVVGTKGTLRVLDIPCPTQLVTPDGILEFPLPKTSAKFFHRSTVGLTYEAEEVRQCIKAGRLESQHITHDESIELARLMDLLRKEVGVIFPEDSQEF